VFRAIDEDRTADGAWFGRDSGQTKVAVSLRRDEPCSTPFASIWPVDSHDAFTQSSLHRVLQTKDQRLVSAERDGYFG